MTAHSKYLVYKPAGGDALVKSGLFTIYFYKDDEAFYAAFDTYLVDATWVNKMSWDNDTDAAQTYALSYTTELKITSGAEVTNSVSIGSEFEGLSVSMDASVKTFSTAETTNAKTKTVTVNVPPHKKVTFYQRRYDFRSTMFFVLDAWREEWNAGSEGGYAITRKNCTVQIYSEDYLTSETELSDSATGTMNVKTVSRFYHEGDRKTRKRENLTTRAKDVLDSMGV